MGKPNRNAYTNKLKWWYDLRRYTARILARSAVPTTPVNLILPFVTGGNTAGNILYANVGAWASSAGIITSYAYQWRSNSVDIPAATGSSLTTVDGVDEGKVISVRVTATNSSGSTSATSLPLPALT